MGKKASSTGFKPHEVEQFARQQNRMNNADVHNFAGSTTTTFGADDQPTITQTLSPEMQGLMDGMMGMLGQGAPQLGNYSNPFIESLLQSTGQRLGATGGFNVAPGASASAPYSFSNPTLMQNSELPTVQAPQQPNPGLSFGYGQGQPATPTPAGEQMNIGQAMRQGMERAAGQDYDQYGQLGGGLGGALAQLMRQRNIPNYQLGGR